MLKATKKQQLDKLIAKYMCIYIYYFYIYLYKTIIKQAMHKAQGAHNWNDLNIH